ncbi:MAG: hypothetical protein WEB60_08175 [Terrimicrobiaceae bacterium]
MKVIFAVVLAKCPRSSAGHTCAIMNWALAFREMGWDVWLVEHLLDAEMEAPEPGFTRSPQEEFWYATTAEFGFTERQCLLINGTSPDLDNFRSAAAEADIFLNYSGQFKRMDLISKSTLKCYLDVDPAFTQLWVETCGVDMNYEGHDRFLTVGTNLNGADVLLPPSSQDWIPVAPPVVAGYWRDRLGAMPQRGPWSTVSHWYGYNDLLWDGHTYGGKRHSLLGLCELPKLLGAPLAIATDLERSWGDYEEFEATGWHILPASGVCKDVDTYLAFLAGSSGELGVAKQGYIVSRGGWISDRSVTYLGFGRPVMLQDTGWTAHLPPQPGLMPFRTPAEAAAGIKEMESDYDAHSQGALLLAKTVFSPQGVLTNLMNRL